MQDCVPQQLKFKHTAMDKLKTATFFTCIARNYLAQAFGLAESVTVHHPDATMVIVVLDDMDRELKGDIEGNGYIPIFADELRIPDFRRFVFQYDVIEACTSIKAFVFLELFRRGAESVIFLDPDICCYGPLDAALDALRTGSIVLTPHICAPFPEEYGLQDKLFLLYGAFNLGFIGVRNSTVGTDFVRWWAKHLLTECIISPSEGLFVDQKWIDLVPCLFDDVVILRNRGYDLAWWNLHERSLRQVDGQYFVNETSERLTFVHFSNFPIDTPSRISTRLVGTSWHEDPPTTDKRGDLAELFEDYGRRLLETGYRRYSTLPYAYGKYDNGQDILSGDRKYFRELDSKNRGYENPFASGKGSFYADCYPDSSALRVMYRYKEIAKKALRMGLRFLIHAIGERTAMKIWGALSQEISNYLADQASRRTR